MPAETPSTVILGVRVACTSVEQILSQVQAWSAAPQVRTILYVNAHCLNLAYADPDYRALLNQADLVYPDGISVVWASRLMGGCAMQKITGADWIDDFCRHAQQQQLKIYLLAGKPGVIERAVEHLRLRYPGLKIVGACDGYFQGKSCERVLHEIRDQQPHVLLVGMGTPRQERWIAQYRQEIAAPVCWAVGALFDYVAGIEPRAPAWMDRLALEWLWRMLIDPRGKWRRYLVGNPSFVYRILRQRFTRQR